MKAFTICTLAFICLVACRPKDAESTTAQKNPATVADGESFYGEDFKNTTVLSPDQMGDIYRNMKPGDTVGVAFVAPVKAVCKERGCWMKLDVGNINPVTVKFKDYGFFVPKDIEQKEVTVNGKAYVAMVSIEELRHLAKDAGKSSEEIAEIKVPKRTFSFMASGVRIQD